MAGCHNGMLVEFMVKLKLKKTMVAKLTEGELGNIVGASGQSPCLESYNCGGGSLACTSTNVSCFYQTGCGTTMTDPLSPQCRLR
jgi:hypothetical protein